MKKIVFICSGNTCRSPMAEGIFKALLGKYGADNCTVESAGTAAYTGLPPTDNAVIAAAENGADISAHRSRQVTHRLLDEADFLVCMTEGHAAAVLPYTDKSKIVVLGIGDPYGGDITVYRKCAAEIKSKLTVFIKERILTMNTYNAVDFSNVNITGGFWYDKQRLNKEVTLDSVREQFEGTGRFKAFEFGWKNGMPDRPHIFWDSDIAKWLESAAFILQKDKNDKLEAYVDAVIDLIEKNQGDDGYFNICFTVIEPEERWTQRMSHELYCAGHLFEAAVAYYNATGKDKFLCCMKKYADYIERVFKIEGSADFTTPGHEEIELALVKLFHCTGEKRYLELSKFFIDARGRTDSKEVIDGDNDNYMQDHVPVREQMTAEGHCVRACYLFCGMADIAREYGDTELAAACEKLFDNITKKRMYITGGIGSTREGERFTGDYDLPNDIAYAETCAAISLAMFAQRMSLLKPSSVYADTAERALYNGTISGLSLDGKSFFYENPLEINLTDRNVPYKYGKNKFPITQRVEVFSCSCCPPNITRFIASAGGYLYSCGSDTLFVHQFADSSSSFVMSGSEVSISQKTDYPISGSVLFGIKGMKNKKLAVRIPSWCDKYSFGDAEYKVDDGYAYISVDSDDFSLSFDMDIVPKWYESAPAVWENIGKVALTRGPVVYCAEGVDNGTLWTLSADIFEDITVCDDTFGGLPVLEAAGYRKKSCECCHAKLYSPVKGDYTPVKIRFIPYYAFANRGETDMAVWIRKF